MPESSYAAGDLTTVSLICPVWEQVVDVSVLCGERGFVGVVGCTLCAPGTACLAPCEAETRRWCEFAGRER